MIACIGKNNELGKDNDLVFHLKRDMQFFRETTLNHTIVMGRKTFKSLKNSALPKRKNIIITSSLKNPPENVEIINNIQDIIEKYQDSEEEIFIIGGASIYSAFLPYAKKLYLTEVDARTNADVYFPEFDKAKYDKIELEKGVENDINFTISKYTAK